MRFTFTSTDINNVTSTRDFHAESWFDALDEFVTFLKGSGYMIPINTVGVNTDNTFFQPEVYSNLTTFKGEE